MKKASTLLILCFICFTLLLSCKKDGLTKATENGANTFSCKINGSVFKPCKDEGLFGGKTLYGGIDQTFNEAFITAECNNPDPQRHVYIQLYNFHGEGEYLLSDFNNVCIYKERYPDKPIPLP